MIRLEGPDNSFPVKRLAYISEKNLLSAIILPVTRQWRAAKALAFITPAQRHLDIGCGDGYLLKRSPCRERLGLDLLLGDRIDKKLDFPDAHFDCVTLLAVIEHLPHAHDILGEIARVLRPEGVFIVTTPKHSSEKILRLYSPKTQNEHVAHFDRASLTLLTETSFRLVRYETFIFGLNQLFVFERRTH